MELNYENYISEALSGAAPRWELGGPGRWLNDLAMGWQRGMGSLLEHRFSPYFSVALWYGVLATGTCVVPHVGWDMAQRQS